MRAERASGTAAMVAYMRALADAGVSHVPEFRDPTARVFLSTKWLRRLEKVERLLRRGRGRFTLAFARVAADLMALRTQTIDAAITDAIVRGAAQVVLLGAGLDGRAWRMRELTGVPLFEVDHPATQAVKRGRLAALPPAFAHVEFVAVDFERESLDAALAVVGHDGAHPTCWVWEGVVMYLTREAMRSTLAGVAARSAPGSTLIVNYHTAMRRGLVGLLLRMQGEPVRSKWSPAEMAADLTAAGFDVVDDSGVTEWAKRYAIGAIESRPGRIMRVVVARRGRA